MSKILGIHTTYTNIVDNANSKRIAKAWAVFNGVTGAVLSSYNVTSVTKNGTGDYTVNFTNSLPDVNYVATMGAGQSGVGPVYTGSISHVTAVVATTTTYRFGTGTAHASGAGMSNQDMDIVRIMFFSN